MTITITIDMTSDVIARFRGVQNSLDIRGKYKPFVTAKTHEALKKEEHMGQLSREYIEIEEKIDILFPTRQAMYRLGLKTKDHYNYTEKRNLVVKYLRRKYSADGYRWVTDA